MKQVAGQIDFDEYLKQITTISLGCEKCICDKCLYWWSMRCKYGKCYDDHRSKIDPFDKSFPEKSPRTGWTEWNNPGEQAHYCRGGAFYPVRYCDNFVKYEGSTVEGCVDAPIQIFQDGYVICSLKEIIGCEACIERNEKLKARNEYDCPYMTDTGCERMITAKSLMLDAMAEGEDIEMCREQCCIGCTKTCGFRCGQRY